MFSGTIGAKIIVYHCMLVVLVQPWQGARAQQQCLGPQAQLRNAKQLVLCVDGVLVPFQTVMMI